MRLWSNSEYILKSSDCNYHNGDIQGRVNRGAESGSLTELKPVCRISSQYKSKIRLRHEEHKMCRAQDSAD